MSGPRDNYDTEYGDNYDDDYGDDIDADELFLGTTLGRASV